jgi:hypothetical protein
MRGLSELLHHSHLLGSPNNILVKQIFFYEALLPESRSRKRNRIFKAPIAIA